MTKKRKGKSGNKGISNLTNTILSILKKDRNQSFNYKQIAAKLGVNDASSRNQIIKTLAKLAAKEEIQQIDRGKFKAIINTEYHIGILDLAAKGNGYIICDDFEDDVFIASNNINKALDGDEVEFYAYKRRKRGKLEGEITNVIKRAKYEYVGVIQIQKNNILLMKLSKKIGILKSIALLFILIGCKNIERDTKSVSENELKSAVKKAISSFLLDDGHIFIPQNVFKFVSANI